MGKTTLFHPVSLQIIRGSAAQCGWYFGRLSQMWLSPDKRRARYMAYVVSWPADVGPGPDNVKAGLQECFAADIQITRVKMDSHHRIVATIETALVAEDES